MTDVLGVVAGPMTPRTPGGGRGEGGRGEDDGEAAGGGGGSRYPSNAADIDKDMMNNMNSFSFSEEGKLVM